MITTTLKEIRSKSPCEEGWKALLEHLGKSGAEAKEDETPLPVMTVLDSNGIDDALWVLDNCINPHIRRLFAADCTESVLHIFEDERPDDTRPRDAIAVARNPEATSEQRDAARAAAWDAARAASGAAAWATAWDAAGAAAWAAAGAAAWAAAGATAWDAAWAAAGATAWDAAGAAAWAAAGAAAWAAAGATAWDAARAAAWDAAWAAARDASGAAAWDAAWATQEKRLRQYLEHGEVAQHMEWPE